MQELTATIRGTMPPLQLEQCHLTGDLAFQGSSAGRPVIQSRWWASWEQARR